MGTCIGRRDVTERTQDPRGRERKKARQIESDQYVLVDSQCVELQTKFKEHKTVCFDMCTAEQGQRKRAKARANIPAQGSFNYDNTQGPDIGIERVAIALDALRRHVRHGPHPRGTHGITCITRFATHAKVGQFALPLAVQEYIARFDISMDYTLVFVQIGHSLEHLKHHACKCVGGNFVVAQAHDIQQRPSIAEFHNNFEHSELVKHAVAGDNRRVVEFKHYLHFVDKRLVFSLICCIHGHFLEREGLIDTFVPNLPHRATHALTQTLAHTLDFHQVLQLHTTFDVPRLKS